MKAVFLRRSTALISCLIWAVLIFVPGHYAEAEERQGIVKRVYNGKSIKLRDGTKIKYIGLSVPDKKGKPFYRMCKEANRKLVAQKLITIKPDTLERTDTQEKIWAYVFADNVFVNAELIKQGYALVHTVEPHELYKKYFQSLQREARSNKRGIWAYEDTDNEPYYVGSNRKKEFHRPGCFHVKNIDFDDKTLFRSKEEALTRGFIQDWRCIPLFKRPVQENK